MTRQHNQRFECPNCKTLNTAETLFGRWVRNNPRLDSGDGFSIVDCDYWIHRFKIHGNREVQCLMLVELKTNGSDLSAAQRDTLHIVDQVMRNRRQTPTKTLVRESGTAPLRVKSSFLMASVNVRLYGVHTLVFSGLGPDDSNSIRWDRKEIDPDMLTKLLAFDLDPDTLRPMDFRSHHAKQAHSELPL